MVNELLANVMAASLENYIEAKNALRRADAELHYSRKALHAILEEAHELTADSHLCRRDQERADGGGES